MPCMWNLKGNDTNEFNLQNRKRPTDLENKHGYWGRDSWGTGNGHVHIAIFKVDNQQGPTIQQPGWEGSLRENVHLCMYG